MNTDEKVLEALRKLTEKQFRNEVLEPLFNKMGAEKVVNNHGSQERGKDFINFWKNSHYGNIEIEVCVVKNAPFSNRADGKNTTASTLTQVHQCKATTVYSHITGTHVLPQSVRLINTYDISDPAASNLSDFLNNLKNTGCIITSTSELLNLLRTKASDIYYSLAGNSDGIIASSLEYVSKHHELIAFSKTRSGNIGDICVSLGMTTSDMQMLYLRDLRQKLEGRKADPIYTTALRYDDLRVIDEYMASLFNRRTFMRIPKKSKSSAKELTDHNRIGIDDILLKSLRVTLNKVLAEKSKQANAYDCMEAINAIDICVEFCKHVQTSCEEYYSIPTKRVDHRSAITISSVDPKVACNLDCNLVVMGEAGSGKTFYARTVAREMLLNGHACVYFPCSRISSDDQSLQDAMVRFYTDICRTNVANAKKYIDDAKCIIIDGCDEAATFELSLIDEINRMILPKPIGIQIDSKDIIIPYFMSKYFRYQRGVLSIRKPMKASLMNLFTFVNGFDNTSINVIKKAYSDGTRRMIVTTRYGKCVDDLEGFARVRLLPFSDSQMNEFYDKWFGDDFTRRKYVRKYLAAHPSILHAARIPITATLIASLCDHDMLRDTPRTIADLYEKRFDLLMDSWSQIKNVSYVNKFSKKDKLSLLSKLAYVMHDSHRREFSRKDIQILWDKSEISKYYRHSVDDFINELVVYNSVVVREAKDIYSLGHLSNQEYLVAKYIVEAQVLKVMVRHALDDWWAGVLRYYLGLVSSQRPLIRLFGLNYPERDIKKKIRMVY